MSKAFHRKRRQFAVRVAFSAMLMLSMLLYTVPSAFAAGGTTGNLTGTIVDKASGNAVAGATISAVSPTGTYKAKTDSRGFFSIVGMIVDTYTVSLEAEGYSPQSLSGVTIQGDGTVGLGTIKVEKQLKEIGRVQARSGSSNFQPTQTISNYTISGDRILQTTGKTASTNENDLALAAPGVTLTDSGQITIRGGLRTEVGYQLDGVPFTEPFFSNNASNAQFNGVRSLQVVAGAGDATQGNQGAGVLNLVPKRGTSPGFGFIDFEAGGPAFDHQFAAEYGFASPNGQWSNYLAFTGQRFNVYNGYANSNAAEYGNYYANAYETSNQFLDNFIFKFGKTQNQSLQILYLNDQMNAYGPYGGVQPASAGINGTYYYPNDPKNLTYGLGALWGAAGGGNFTNQVGLNPDVPGFIPGSATQYLQQAWNPTRYLKFQYDNSLDSNTFLSLAYYNWETLQGSSNTYGTVDVGSSSGLGFGAYPRLESTGGPRVGTIFNLTRQFGSKSTVTLNASYETQHPVWNDYDPQALVGLLEFNSLFGAFGQGLPCWSKGTTGAAPCASDWGPGGYLSQYFPNGIPRTPVTGINYNGAWYQQYGVGLRWQFVPIAPLHLDLGIREDFQRQHYGINPWNGGDASNPSDLNPANITSYYLDPQVIQPRAALAYQIDPRDSFRFSYGRSVEFLNAQTAGTPAGIYSNEAFAHIPALPGFQCGSGQAHAPAVPCRSYADQLFWLYDQNFDAPDYGGARPAIYNNYDASFSHLFNGGYAVRVTPFYRQGVNVPSFALVTSLSGGAAVFLANNLGISKSTGVELGFNTPDKAVGLTGFLSATYQNVISTTPPLIGGEDSLPINGSGSLGLGDTYRAGYVAPVSLRVGASYRTHDGWRFNPVLQFDSGYPYGVGNTLASSSECINGKFANVPQINFGCGVTAVGGYQNSGGTQISTNYYDPVYSGTQLNPNIAATRGTPAKSSTGGELWLPNLQANLTIEHKDHSGNTLGLQLQNLFGNVYNGTIPGVNPYYQPVATGLSGPQTGKNPNNGSGPGFANLPADTYAYNNGAYLLFPNQPMTFNLYYQRSF